METLMLEVVETLVLGEVEILVMGVVEVELIVQEPLQGMEVVVVAVEEIMVMVKVKGYPQRCHPTNHQIHNLPLRKPTNPHLGETKAPEHPQIKD